MQTSRIEPVHDPDTGSWVVQRRDCAPATLITDWSQSSLGHVMKVGPYRQPAGLSVGDMDFGFSHRRNGRHGSSSRLLVNGICARGIEGTMTVQQIVCLNGRLTRPRHADGEVSARLMAGVGYMSRVVLPVAIAVVLAGCSMNSKSLTASFNDGGTGTTASTSRQGALGGEPAGRTVKTKDTATGSTQPASGTKVASADRAPQGTYDKAPKGALSDRDYSQTKLDPNVVLELVNQYRKQNGLKVLKLNAELSDAAKNHSRDLAKWDRISHFGSDGSNPWDRVKRTGYNARLAAENVGTGQVTIEEVFKGWKESPGHNKNLLLADAEHMGVALVQEPKTEFKTFWTLVLGAPL